MPQKDTVERSILKAVVAYETSKGTLQQPIADILGISQPEVSRLRTEARNDGWLGLPSFNIIERDVWKQAEDRFYATEPLCAALRRRAGQQRRQLHRIILLHTGHGGRIDAGAVDSFTVLLGNANTVGVTWGRTISRVVDALKQRNIAVSASSRRPYVTFVPLCGEPLADGDPSSHSSSVLAQRLTEIFNGGGTAVAPPSIAGVQAFIPLKVGRLEETATIRHLISLVRGHARIFGTPDGPNGNETPLVDRLDAILTSVGRADQDRRGTFLTERIQVGDITEAQMIRSVAGDIGGVIIPKAGIHPDDERLIAAMNSNWTGVRLEHLRKCADAARSAGFPPERPGVVLLALGARRLRVVLRCLQLGLVNQLVIDKELADRLTEYVAPPRT